MLGILYNLEIIYERKEEPINDDIEEVKHRYIYGLSEKEEEIDDRVSEIEKKLNEVIRKLKEMGKSE